jgi:hypothetical protein
MKAPDKMQTKGLAPSDEEAQWLDAAGFIYFQLLPVKVCEPWLAWFAPSAVSRATTSI